MAKPKKSVYKKTYEAINGPESDTSSLLGVSRKALAVTVAASAAIAAAGIDAFSSIIARNRFEDENDFYYLKDSEKTQRKPKEIDLEKKLEEIDILAENLKPEIIENLTDPDLDHIEVHQDQENGETLLDFGQEVTLAEGSLKVISRGVGRIRIQFKPHGSNEPLIDVIIPAMQQEFDIAKELNFKSGEIKKGKLLLYILNSNNQKIKQLFIKSLSAERSIGQN